VKHLKAKQNEKIILTHQANFQEVLVLYLLCISNFLGLWFGTGDNNDSDIDVVLQ
jgi:hypothetical protein